MLNKGLQNRGTTVYMTGNCLLVAITCITTINIVAMYHAGVAYDL